MLIINVPYEEKEEAKKLGAKWNIRLKKWMVERPQNYPNFFQWFPTVKKNEDRYIIYDHIYIMAGIYTCKYCKVQTMVVGFALDNYFDVDGFHFNVVDRWSKYDYNFAESDGYENLILTTNINIFPDEIMKKLNNKIFELFGEQKRNDYFYQVNHDKLCIYRKSINGTYYRISESIFNFWNEKEKEWTNKKVYDNVAFYKCNLENEYFCSIGFYDWLERKDFNKYANIKELSKEFIL